MRRPRSTAYVLRGALVLAGLLLFGACVVSEQFDDAQFLCDPQGGQDECPSGMSCGLDGVCRHATAKPDGSAGTGGKDGSADGCFPVNCSALAPKCGTLDDGCGHSLECGCSAPNTCGGGGKTGECGCTRNRTATGKPTAAFEQKVTGNVDWKTPTAALASDDDWATTVSAVAAGKSTSILKVSAFSFDGLPTSAQDTVIKGIEITVERSATSSASSIKDQAVNLLIAGSPAAKPAANGSAWSTTDAVVKYGGATDLWGETSITLDQVRESTFGVSLSATATASDSPRVDAIGMTVHFEDTSCPAN